MLNLHNTLWAGTEEALNFALALEAKILAADLRAFHRGAEEEDSPPYQRAGNVAIISTRGPLLNVDNPILEFFGIATYPGIRRKFIAAAQDAKVEHIVHDIDSGGGAVSGVDDTGQLIASVNRRIKPVTTFTGGNMLSAALWLGVSAHKVFASRTAMVGSLGVIATHMDHSEALKKEGIKPTVIRVGKFKALANPMEPLTDAAREQIETKMEAAYRLFVEHVSASRKVDYAVADKKMGEGREFFGEQAKAVGLVDGISTFDAMLSVLQAKKGVDKSRAAI
jgi:signal peptide peptidase SppA